MYSMEYMVFRLNFKEMSMLTISVLNSAYSTEVRNVTCQSIVFLCD